MGTLLSHHSPLSGWYLFLIISVFVLTSVSVFSCISPLPITQGFGSSRSLQHNDLQPWEQDTVNEYRMKLHSKLARSALPQVREHNLTLSSATTRDFGMLLTINGKYPGPLIEAVEGDIIRITVTNDLDASFGTTMIHFHGMFMNGTNYLGGVEGVTQCGLPRGRSFTYEFVATPAGTTWYHAHSGLQQAQGLVGPLVIHERIRPDKESRESVVDSEQLVIFTDIYSRPVNDLFLTYREPWIGGNEEPVPRQVLIQGKRQALIEMAKGERTRLRLVNACSFSAVNVMLNNDTLTVTEVDGTAVEPAQVEVLPIFPAQRYSATLLVTENTYLLASPDMAMYDAPEEGEFRDIDQMNAGSSAVLLVNKSQPLPKIATPRVKEFTSSLSEPYFRPAFSEALPLASETKHVGFSMIRLPEGEAAGAINDFAYDNDDVEQNVLMSFLRPHISTIKGHHHHHRHQQQQHHPHYRDPTDHLNDVPSFPGPLMEDKRHTTQAGNGSNFLYTAKEPVTVDFVLENYDDGPHPVHLHGHRFWILGRGSMRKEPDSELWAPPGSPLARDTVLLGRDEWVKIRVKLDHPGIWVLHCHIPWHSVTGMRTLIATMPEEIKMMKPPGEWFELCY